MGQSMSGASGGSVTGLEIFARKFTMGPKLVTGITDDGTNGSSNNLITAAALQTAIATVIAAIQSDVQNVLTGLDGLTVLTKNLVSDTFQLLSTDPNLGWIATGWISSNNTASISNVNNVFLVSNKLSVPPGRYPNSGIYFLTLTVSMTSGNLSVLLNNQVVETITSSGTYNVVLNVVNATNTTLDIVAADVADNNSIILTNAVLTGVNSVLYNLIAFLAQDLVDSESSADIAAALAAAEAYTNTSLAAIAVEPNPYPQYELVADASGGSSISPDEIIYSPDAFVPSQIPGSNILRSSTIIKAYKLNHISSSAYCAQSGYLTSTVLTTTPLSNAVINSGSASVEPIAIFVLNTVNLPVVKYTFLKPRKLSEVVLFTSVQASVACVTEATISAGGTTVTVNISPGSTNTIVTGTGTFSDILVNDITITVISVSDTTQPNLSLGFNVDFSDTVSQYIAVSSDTTIAIKYNNSVVQITPSDDIPIDVDTIVVGHEYILSVLTTDGIILTPEVIEIAPVRGDGSIQYQHPLSQLTSNTDPYYGTTSITGTSSSNLYQVYNDSGIIVNSNYLAITQAFSKPVKVDHINIKVPITLTSGLGYPTNITVNVTPFGNTQTSLTIPAIYVNDGISMYYDIHVDLSSYEILSQFQIILISANGTLCALSKLEVAVSALSYDTTEDIWSDGAYRKIVGSVTLLSNGSYQITSQPVGNECVVPINDLLQAQFYTQYTVQNPFKTKNIEVFPITPKGSPTNNILVQSITDSTINVLCTQAGIYLLNITRPN